MIKKAWIKQLIEKKQKCENFSVLFTTINMKLYPTVAIRLSNSLLFRLF